MNKFMRMAAMLLVLVTVFAFVACTSSEGDPSNSTDSTAQTSSSTEAGSSSSSTKAEPVITFRVQVLDEAGNAVPGIYVQICSTTSCYTPVASNEEGWAEFTNPVGEGCYATIFNYDPEVCTLEIPEGKQLDTTTKHYVVDGETEMTITLAFVDAEA